MLGHVRDAFYIRGLGFLIVWAEVLDGLPSWGGLGPDTPLRLSRKGLRGGDCPLGLYP